MSSIAAGVLAAGATFALSSPAHAVVNAGVWSSTQASGGHSYCASSGGVAWNTSFTMCVQIQNTSYGQIARAFARVGNYDSYADRIAVYYIQTWEGSTELDVSSCAERSIPASSTYYCYGNWAYTHSTTSLKQGRPGIGDVLVIPPNDYAQTGDGIGSDTAWTTRSPAKAS